MHTYPGLHWQPHFPRSRAELERQVGEGEGEDGVECTCCREVLEQGRVCFVVSGVSQQLVHALNYPVKNFKFDIFRSLLFNNWMENIKNTKEIFS